MLLTYGFKFPMKWNGLKKSMKSQLKLHCDFLRIWAPFWSISNLYIWNLSLSNFKSIKTFFKLSVIRKDILSLFNKKQQESEPILPKEEILKRLERAKKYGGGNQEQTDKLKAMLRKYRFQQSSWTNKKWNNMKRYNEFMKTSYIVALKSFSAIGPPMWCLRHFTTYLLSSTVFYYFQGVIVHTNIIHYLTKTFLFYRSSPCGV